MYLAKLFYSRGCYHQWCRQYRMRQHQAGDGGVQPDPSEPLFLFELPHILNRATDFIMMNGQKLRN